MAVLGSITESRQVLVVAARGDDVTVKSLRNAPQVHLLTPDQLNTYDVLCADDVVFTRTALEAFLARSTADAAAEATNESDVETTEEVAE
ncbi:MAG: 50S ribosomal protein L4 [Jiangellaceae bacterium]